MLRRMNLLLLLAAAGCSGPEPPSAPSGDLVTQGRERSAVVVRQIGSIQTAVDTASVGDVIHIQPGVYREAITVSTPGIKLVGTGGTGDHQDRVVIENPGDAENGITATPTADGFELDNVTVHGFEENGVFLLGVHGFRLSRVVARYNGEYGLFPVLSSRGVIEHSVAIGHSDTGIYVGLSEDVEVRHSKAFANVNGFEVENSSNVRLIANESFDNVAGILVVLLPGHEVKTSSNLLISRNHVHDNNRENFAEHGFEAVVPTGSGILVVGTDHTVVRGNTATGNDFVGIAVGSTLLLGELAGLPPDAFADIEPNPDGARILHNVVTGNGDNPQPPISELLPGVDLLWDGSGTDNCWGENTFGESFPIGLPACD